MKRALITLLLAASNFGPLQAKEATPLADDPVVEQRLNAIAEEMRCLVCQNESLSASQSELAQDLRRELRTLIRQGRTDAEIREFMVSRYGDFVLYRPRLQPATWLLWFGPFALAIGGIGVLLVFLRRRGQAPVDPALDDDDARRAQSLAQGADS